MRKRFWIGALAALMALSCGGALAACGENSGKLDDFIYDYTEKAENFGDGIDIDGKLDEAHWGEGRAFTSRVRNTTVDYEMRSYFGAGGIYFGFNIKDDAVFYAPEREIWANSGVEFLVGTVEGNTYEIDLNAGGKRMLRKFVGGEHPFLNWFSDLHSAVYVDGTLNGECRGYSAEIYLPYNLFHLDNSEEAVNTVLIHPALIRASSADATNTDRLWVSIGEDERGIAYTSAQDNWYRFRKDEGLVASDVTLHAGEHGSLSGRTYNIPGDNYTVTVKPDEGYCLKTLLFDGEDVTDKLTYDGSGAAVYTAKKSEAFTVEASFEALSSQKHTVSGTVTAESSLSNPKLFAVHMGAYRDIAVGSDGKYSTELPAGVWTLYCSADGYLTWFGDVDMSGDATQDIALVTNYLTPSADGEWDFTYLGNGIASSTSSAWWHFATHKTMKGTRIFASANLVIPKAGGDPRVGLLFTTGPDELFVGFSYESSGYHLQVIHNGADWLGEIGIDGIVDLVPGFETLASTSGVPVSCLYENGRVTISVNGITVRKNVPVGAQFGFTESVEVTPGIIATGTAVTSLRNLTFVKPAEGSYPIRLAQEGRGTLSTAKDSFTQGESLVIDVSPDEGYMLTALTVNGENRLSNVENGKLTVDTAGMTMLEVSAVFTRRLTEKSSFKATVTAGGENAEGIEVALWDQTNRTLAKEVTAANGTVTFSDLTAGKYTVYVNAQEYPDGSKNDHYNSAYDTVTQETVVNGETEQTYSLPAYDKEKAMQEKYAIMQGDAFTLRDIEDGKIVYTDKGQAGGESHMKSTITVEADEDFYLETVLKDQSCFIHTDGAGIRYGFTIYADGAAEYHLTFAWHPDTGSYKIEFTNWSGYDPNNYPSLSEEQVAAWKGEGLRIAVARIGGVFRAYVETDGVMKDFYHTVNDQMTEAKLNLGFAGWFQARGAEFNELHWTIGDVPVQLNVAKSENVSVTTEGTLALGKDITLVFTPEAGYIPSEVKVNGVLKNPVQGKNGTYTLTLENYLEAKTLTVEAVFVERKNADLTLKITLHRLGIGENNRTAIPDGTTVGIDGSGIEKTVQASGGKAVFEGIAAGNYTVTVEGYESVIVEVTATGEKEITLEYAFSASVNPEFFDLSKINDGTVTYLDKGQTGGEAHLRLDKTTGTGDFFLTAVLRKQDPFIMDDAGGLRLGFTLYSNQPDLHMTFLKNGTSENYAFAANNWGDIGKDAPLPAEAVEAWKGAGLRIALVRFRGVLYTCAEIGGSWRAILSVDGPKVAETDFNYGFAGWFQARGAEFTELAYGNDIPQAIKDAFKLKVTQNVQGATLTTDPEAPLKGDDVKLIFKPQTGYLPKSVMVGEYSVLDRLTLEENGDYTVTLTNRQWDIDVVAEFGPAGEATVALTVKLHKLGTGENNLSAIGDGVNVKLVGMKTYEAVSLGGRADFGKVDTGTYKVQVEGYFDGELTVDINVDREIVLEYKLYASKTDLIDADKINDGELTFKKGDGQKLWLEQTVAPDEDFLLLGRFHDYFMDSMSDDVRLGMKVGADLDGDGHGEPWDDLWIASETLSLCLQARRANGGVTVDFPPYFESSSYDFAAEDVARIKGSEGVMIGFARIGGKYHILVQAAAEKGGYYVYTFSENAWAFNSVNQSVPLRVGFFSGHGLAQDVAAKVSDISLTVVKTGEGIKNAALEKYFRLSVEKNVMGASVALDPETPYSGDTVKLTFTPSVETDKPKKVMVGGTSVLDRLSEEEGVYTVSIENCRHALTIVAEFANEKEYEVSLNVKLHRYGNGPDNLRAVTDADNLRLVGPVIRTATVEDGAASFGPVPMGEYQITVDGYKTQTLTVEEAVSGREITLEYDILAQGSDQFNTERIVDGEATYTGREGEADIKFNFFAEAGENFYISAVVKLESGMNASDLRYGFGIWNEGGGFFNANVTTFEGRLQLQMTNWSAFPNADFPEDLVTAYKGDGIRIIAGRQNGVYYMGYELNGEVKIAFTSADFGDYNGKVQLGLRGWAAGASGATFKEITFETAGADASFADEKVQAAVNSMNG